MLNRPANVYRERDRRGTPPDRPWQIDERPAARLAWLFVLICLPPVCVVGRIVQLQQRLGGEIAATSGDTRETFETIPSRDGRILGSDGRVLARDVGTFDVLVNYRWLEEPPDPAWLRRQALARLDRNSRTDTDRVAREEQAVLAARDAMWERLARLTGRDGADLARRRAAIRRRVERMLASVEDRQSRRHEPGGRSGTPAQSTTPAWKRAWRTLVTTLTTTPERDEPDPLVLPEQSAEHLLLEDIPLEIAAEIESHPELYPGLSTRVSSWRDYPHGALAAHVVGLRRAVADDPLAGREPSRPAGDRLDDRRDNRRGETGVERTYDRSLHGAHGVRRIVRNGRGEVLSSEIVRPPRRGHDVVLTLDLALQERLEQLLDRVLAERHGGEDRRTELHSVRVEDGRSETPSYGFDGRSETPSYGSSAGACIVALDARTGAVLAAVSAPRFDLRIAAAPDAESWQSLLDDPRRPLFHRAVSMTLPPGSTFKALSAVAMLESGRIDPDAKMFCQGYLDRPDRYRCYVYRHFGHGHGETDLNDALARSCNVYFFQAARTIGPEPIIEWAGRFGFGQPTGVDLPGEAAGRVPRPSDAGPWYPGDALGLAIGQSRLTVTPLQVARLMATIANGGWLVTPHVVGGFGPSQSDDNGAATRPARPEPQRLAGLREGTLDRIREGLERVVAHPGGTGYKHVRLKDVAIAGKTGTAEVGGGKQDHAWFAGYVPADRPKIAFAVVLEHGGSGGAVAGTVAREMVRVMLELGLVP
ncbi:MAG TPA: penicillin-binding transpeptidase domain-containing protein [Planctomycetaceae bacterium]|nr:penicillin-binding transpeptidase domain-containing protein [Planctomycetaceae bacterium]